MRLSQQQIKQIYQTVISKTDQQAKVYLYGLRLDDNARGGDIDLLVKTASPLSLLDKARIKMTLEAILMIPIDIISTTLNANNDKSPFLKMVELEAVLLKENDR